MQPFAPRAGRLPLALALTLTALTALTACSDDPVAPKTAGPVAAKIALVAAADTYVVTTTSGGMEPGSLRWIAKKMEYSGGTILFDPALAGKTITLDDRFEIYHTAAIIGPAKGITISGNNTFRLMYVSHLTMENVTLTKGNGEFGSAIEAWSAVLRHTTVQGNGGPSSAIQVTGNLELLNSTVSGNTVAGPVVEYSGSSQVLIDHSTIAFNATGTALGRRSNVNWHHYVMLRNSILANNRQNCADYAGFLYAGTNIVDDGSCADVAIPPTDPQLMPLAYNGGPNMTHAIPHTSPAFNKGTECWSTDVDQRYVPRDAKCDVGAFEFNDWTKVTITIDPTVKLDAATGQALLSGTIKCTRNDYVSLALELHQDQKVGKQVVDIHSADVLPLECTPSGGSWSTHMPLAAGEAFQAGAARATAVTFQAGEWVTPASVASPIKMSIARK